MATEIRLIARSTDGKAQTFRYKAGSKHTAEQNTIYKLVVDGSEQMPAGTKIFRKGNDIVVQFADGQVFEMGGWCSVAGSRLIDLERVEALRTADGAFAPINEIGSGACLLASGSGETVGSLGDLSSQTATATATPVANSGGSLGYILGGLAVLGLAGAAGGGGGGGGDSGGSTTKPAGPKSLKLGLTSDSGVQGDNVTNDATPTITGKGESGQTIELRDAATNALIGSTIVDSNGDWSLTPAAPLPEGANAFNLTAISSGQASDPVAFSLMIDSTPPPAQTGELSVGSDTGTTNDAMTNDATPTISGTGEPGQTIELRNAGGNAIGTATVDANGNWSITPSAPLPEGLNELQLITTDISGNISTPTSLMLTIDSVAPPAPAAALDPGSDSTTPGDGLTNDTTPTFSAGGANPSDIITVTFPGGEIVTTTVASDGTWSVTPTTPLSDGVNNIVVTATDPAGNVSAPTTIPLNVDGTPSPAPAAVLAPTSDSGTTGDIVTNDATPTVSGNNSNPDDIITVTFPGGEIITTIVAGDGSWSVTPITPLADGLNNVSITSTDPVGNVSAPTALMVTIDTTAPTSPTVAVAEGPAINAAEAISDGGVPVAVTLPIDAAVGDIITVSIDGSTPVNYTLTAADIAAIATPITVMIPTADITAAGQGPAVVTTTYTDAAGNAATPVTTELTIDPGAPDAPTVVVVDGPAINGAESNNEGGVPVDITLPANASVGDVITVSIDGSAPVSYTVTAADVAALGTPITVSIPTADLNGAGQGPAVVTTTYADAAGNAATPVTTNLTIDTIAPSSPSIAIADGPVINAAEASSGDGVPVAVTLPVDAKVDDVIAVSIDGSDPVSYTVTAADVTAIATSITILIPAAEIAAAGEGPAVVTTTYTDAAGNAATPVTTNLTIDTATPASPSVSVPDGPNINASEVLSDVPVSVTLPADAAAGDVITVNIDGSAPVSHTVTAADVAAIATPISILIPAADIAAAGEGPAAVTTTYTDAAGNAATPVTTNLIIDTTAPTDPTIAVAEGPAINAAEATSGGGVPVAVTLPVDATEGDVITVSIDGSAPVNYTVTAADVAAIATPISVLIPTASITAAGQGLAVVTTTYADAAGNAATPVTTDLTIDTVAPSSPTIAVVEGPVINVAEASSGGGVPVAATLPVNAAVGDVITVSIDGSTPVSYTVTAADVAAIATPISILIPADDIAAAAEGPAAITTTYTDAAGNAATPVTTILTIDTATPSAPTVAISEGSGINAAEASSGGGVPVAVTLPANAAVGDVITVSIDGSTPVSYTVTAANVAAIATPISILIPTAAITAAGQGAAVVTTTYTDAAGNAAIPVTTNLTIDTTAPSAPTVAVAEGPAINAAEASSGGGVPVAVTLPVDAAVGDIITVSIDGSTPVNYTVTAADIAAIATPISVLIPTAAITAAGQGAAVVTTTYADAAGNAATSVTTNLTIDTTAPLSPSVAVAEGPAINAAESTSGGGVPVAVTLPSNAAIGDVITVSIDGSTPVSYTVTAANIAAIATPISILIPTADITAAGEGPAVVTTTYTDAAGNAATPVATNLTIDTIAPLSPSIAVAEGPVISAAESTSGGGVPVAVTLPSDAAVGDVITVSIDGSAPANYTVTAADVAAIATPISVLIPTAAITAAGQGAAVVTTTYIDAAGNAATPVTANLTIDTAGPVITGSSPLDNAVNVLPSDTITITYNETLTAGSANQAITLYNFTTGAAVETFNVTTGIGSQGGSLSVVGNSVTLTLGAPTNTGTHYDIQTQAGAFNDSLGNPSNAIASNTALDFTTVTPAATVTVANLASTTYSQYLHTINPNLVNSNSLGVLPGGGFGTAVFTGQDDNAATVSITPAFSTGLNWFGTNYTSVGIGSNGYITFGHLNNSYSAVGIPGYTTGGMIAVQFDDWYSRAHAITGPTPGGNSTGTDNTYFAAYQNAGSGVVTLTYDDVGYFAAAAPGATDGLTTNNYTRGNAEQIRLVGTATGETVIQLVYESVNWVNGNTGFPTAGWTKGNGVTYGVVDGNVPGASTGGVSGTVNFLDVESVSNVGIPGVYEWVLGSDGLVAAGNAPLLNTHATGSALLAAQLNATGGTATYAQDAIHWDSRFTLIGNQIQSNAGASFAPSETEVELWVRVTDTTSGLIYPKVVTVTLFDQIGGSGNDQIGIRSATDITKLTNAVASQVVMNGNAGEDTLVFTGTGLYLDLTMVQDSALINVEKVDLGSGNTMKLALADLFAMSAPNQFNSGNGWVGLPGAVTLEQLVIDGNATDTVNILNSGTNAGFWSTTSAGTVTHGGQSYAIYNSTASTGQLLIDTDVQVAFG